jgi:hypothetical protein
MCVYLFRSRRLDFSEASSAGSVGLRRPADRRRSAPEYPLGDLPFFVLTGLIIAGGHRIDATARWLVRFSGLRLTGPIGLDRKAEPTTVERWIPLPAVAGSSRVGYPKFNRWQFAGLCRQGLWWERPVPNFGGSTPLQVLERG